MQNNSIHLILVLFIIFYSSTTSFSQISGTVYQDLPVNGTILNTYGVKDANELGVEGVTVTVYPGGATTTTANDGTYSFLVADAPIGDMRVEFSWPTKTWLQSSPDAAMQNSSVMFVTAPSVGVDFGLHNPINYANNEADIAMTFQCNNSGVDNSLFTVRVLRNTDIPGVTNAGLPTDGDYDNNGLQNAHPINGDKIGFIHETGSVWGTAYNRVTEDVYVSSFVRRYTAMGRQEWEPYIKLIMLIM